MLLRLIRFSERVIERSIEHFVISCLSVLGFGYIVARYWFYFD